MVGLFSAGRKLETGKVTVHRVDQRYPTSFGDGGTTRWTTDVGFDDAVLPGMSIPLHFQVAQTPKAHVREELDSLFQNRVIPTLLAGGTHTENRWILPKFASHEGNDWLRLFVEIAITGIQVPVLAPDPLLGHDRFRPGTAQVVGCQELLRRGQQICLRSRCISFPVRSLEPRLHDARKWYLL